MRWDLAGVVLHKEIIDSLRDRRTLILAIVFPLLGPVLLGATIFLVSRQARTVAEEPLALPVVGAERAPNLMAFLRERAVDVVPAPADPVAAVWTGDADVVLVIPPEHEARLRGGRPAPVRLILDESRTSARPAAARVRQLLAGYSRQLGALRLLVRGVHPSTAEGLAIEAQELSTSQSRAALLLSVLPYFLVMALFVGGMGVATDATAGARERQALEPLLLNPVPRSAVVVGKLLAVAVFSALTLLETTAGFGLVPLALPLQALGFHIRLDPLVLLRILLLLLPLLLLVAAGMVALAARARTFKAAQSLLSVLMLVPAAPGIVLALVPVKLQGWMMLVPAFSEQLLVTRLIRGEAVGAQAMATAMASTACWAAAAVWLAVRAFEDERLLFGRVG